MVHVKSHVHGVEANGWNEVFIFVVVTKHPNFFLNAGRQFFDFFFGKRKLFDLEQADQRTGPFGDVSDGKYANTVNG